MMDKLEFGQLIAALRKYQINPSTGTHWTQQELAEQANLSYKTVVNIEQGRRVSLDADTLIRLAGALRLTTLERQKFFTLATSVASVNILREIQEPAKLLEEVLNILYTAQVPAAVYEPFYHVIAVNGQGLALHPSEVELDPSALSDGIHFLRCVLEAQATVRRDLSTIWDQFLGLTIHRFRVMSLRYRHTTYFQELFDDLLRYEDFRSAWIASQFDDSDYYTQLSHYRYHHPMYGTLEYVTGIEEMPTSVGSLYIMLLTPLDHHTSTTFYQTMKNQGQIIQRLTPWPHVGLTISLSSD